MKNFILLICLFLGGCVSGSFEYTPPNQLSKINNSKIIINNKDVVWKNTISNLGASFFVINNIDKSSGFINLSFSGNPEKYIDCGHVKSIVDNLSGKRVYDFSASSENKKYESYINGQLYAFDRGVSLEGRINIIIQEISNNETLATVNTKYIVNRDFNIFDVTGKKIESSRQSISFNTNNSDTFKSEDNKGTTCISSGLLEREILNLIE